MYSMDENVVVAQNWEDARFEKMQQLFLRLNNNLAINIPILKQLELKVDSLHIRYFDRKQNETAFRDRQKRRNQAKVRDMLENEVLKL